MEKYVENEQTNEIINQIADLIHSGQTDIQVAEYLTQKEVLNPAYAEIYWTEKDINQIRIDHRLTTDDMKFCTNCLKEVKQEAIKCRHCDADLSASNIDIAPTYNNKKSEPQFPIENPSSLLTSAYQLKLFEEIPVEKRGLFLIEFRKKKKTKLKLFIWWFFLGSLGAHFIYLIGTKELFDFDSASKSKSIADPPGGALIIYWIILGWNVFFGTPGIFFYIVYSLVTLSGLFFLFADLDKIFNDEIAIDVKCDV